MLIAPHGYRPRQWLFDLEQQIKTRDTNPLRFIEKTERKNYSLPALIQLRNARRVARVVALRAVKSIATQTNGDRAQQQRCLNELIETLNGAWLRGQQNHDNSRAHKPDACASNGQVDRVTMQRKHTRKSDINTVKRMRGGLWPENRRSGGPKPKARKKKATRRKKQ